MVPIQEPQYPADIQLIQVLCTLYPSCRTVVLSGQTKTSRPCKLNGRMRISLNVFPAVHNNASIAHNDSGSQSHHPLA